MSLHRLAVAGACALAAVRGMPARAQAVTRAEAVARAVARGPRLAIARADSSLARAQLSTARQFENPTFGYQYTKSTPQQHYSLDVPIDFPWLRDPRIGSAQAGLGAAAYRFAYEREAVAYDADTTYTRALATAAHAQLSRRTAFDADSLLTLARLRRDAGDASELDVQLAAVTAGQLDNAAAADSLDATTALLALQAVMGMPADAPVIALADSLALSTGLDAPTTSGTALLVAAAEEDARAASLAVTLERRRAFPNASLSLGYETQDPSGSEPGTLPTIGFSLPVPVFNQNRAAVQVAEAQRERALAQLALARIDAASSLARALRTFMVAQDRATRSQQLLASADRVATLSFLAYREGAAALPSVLEAQRTAREARAHYVDDVAAARNAAGAVRLLQNRTPTVNRAIQ